MSLLQKAAFGIAVICLAAWVAAVVVAPDFEPALLLWASLVSFMIGFIALTFEYARAVAIEESDQNG